MKKLLISSSTLRTWQFCSLIAIKTSDPDLLICPGGNNVPDNSRQLQLRLFKNDGKGNFELDPNAFPVNNANISVATAYDFDGDGDLDLLLGAAACLMNMD